MKCYLIIYWDYCLWKDILDILYSIILFIYFALFFWNLYDFINNLIKLLFDYLSFNNTINR